MIILGVKPDGTLVRTRDLRIDDAIFENNRHGAHQPPPFSFERGRRVIEHKKRIQAMLLKI